MMGACSKLFRRIVEWVGWMIAARSLESVAFAVFSFANLALVLGLIITGIQ